MYLFDKSKLRIKAYVIPENMNTESNLPPLPNFQLKGKAICNCKIKWVCLETMVRTVRTKNNQQKPMQKLFRHLLLDKTGMKGFC